MVYKDLRAILGLLNDIRNGVNWIDFDKVIKKLEKGLNYGQILDEWKYFKREEKRGEISKNNNAKQKGF